MFRLSGLITVLVVGLTACIESPPAPVTMTDMDDVGTNDTGNNITENNIVSNNLNNLQDMGLDSEPDAEQPDCSGDDQCGNGVCEEGICIPCRESSCDGVLDRTQCKEAENPLENACVQCLTSEHCDDKVCDPGTNTCVTCLENVNCGDGMICTEETEVALRECVQCLGDEDCPMGRCLQVSERTSNKCVQCLPDTQNQDCNGNVCSPDSLTCTTIKLASTDALLPCEYDAQCEMGHACVPLDYMEVPHGNYCMPLFVQGTPCGRPYGAPVAMRTSVGGANVTVCMIKEDLTTPEAIVAYENPCTLATATMDCPTGGRCEIYDLIATTRICTYTCSGPTDCLTGSTCLGVTDRYCGPN